MKNIVFKKPVAAIIIGFLVIIGLVYVILFLIVPRIGGGVHIVAYSVPVWSPDGEKIAVVKTEEYSKITRIKCSEVMLPCEDQEFLFSGVVTGVLYIFDVKNSEVLQKILLAKKSFRDSNRHSYFHSFKLSPVHIQWRGSSIYIEGAWTGETYWGVYRLDSGRLVKLFLDAPIGGTGDIILSTLSPDGKKLAFTDTYWNFSSDYFLLDLDTFQMTRHSFIKKVEGEYIYAYHTANDAIDFYWNDNNQLVIFDGYEFDVVNSQSGKVELSSAVLGNFRREVTRFFGMEENTVLPAYPIKYIPGHPLDKMFIPNYYNDRWAIKELDDDVKYKEDEYGEYKIVLPGYNGKTLSPDGRYAALRYRDKKSVTYKRIPIVKHYTLCRDKLFILSLLKPGSKREITPYFEGSYKPEIPLVIKGRIHLKDPKPKALVEQRARDSKRKSDLQKLKSILKKYYKIYHHFPSSPNLSKSTSDNFVLKVLVDKGLLDAVPQDPFVNKGWFYGYMCNIVSGDQFYELTARLELHEESGYLCSPDIPCVYTESGWEPQVNLK